MIFSKVLGKAGVHALSSDLKRLNQFEAGLGDKAINFVSTGEDETVLATISTKATGNVLDVSPGSYSSGTAATRRTRGDFFLDAPASDRDILFRYAQVLATSLKDTSHTVLGSDKEPLELRIFFSEAAHAAYDTHKAWPPTPRTTPPQGLTAEAMVPMAEALGGTSAHLFTLLYWEDGTYYTDGPEMLRSLTDMKALIAENPDAALKGIGKAPVAGRVTFVRHIAKLARDGQDIFASALLDFAGDGSKAVREVAQKALRHLPPDYVEEGATARLAKGAVTTRAAMVDLLKANGSDTAMATLKAHLKGEKTARIKAAIESAFSVAEVREGAPADDATGYTAIDGSRVDIPPLRPLDCTDIEQLSKAERKLLKERLDAQNAKIEARNEAKKGQKYYSRRPLYPDTVIDGFEKLILGKLPEDNHRHMTLNFAYQHAPDLIRERHDAVSIGTALRSVFQSLPNLDYWLSPHLPGPSNQVVQRFLNSADADLRAVEKLWSDSDMVVSTGGWQNRNTHKAGKGDVLRAMIPADSYAGSDPDVVPREALWPYLAENLDTLAHAFDAGSGDIETLDRVRGIQCLAALPKVPMRFLGPLLDVATGARKAGKLEARALLTDVAEVDDRLKALLDDTRQAVRAGAAEWMGERGKKDAVAPLKKRWKKEKSELAKAAILTALKALGEPVDEFVGPTVLLREAEAGLKKAKLDKLAWMPFDSLPPLKFRNGKNAPLDLVRWWMALAVKLKQPAGNALFDSYLEQLDPSSAETLSDWVLSSWLSYDTEVPSADEAHAFADKNAQNQYNAWKPYVSGYSLQQAYADILRAQRHAYLNSGTATKGLLAFATCVPSQSAADRVRAYLKNHGSRTSQASSLLDVLAHKGDPVSLQVVISAATRLKQKGVQAYAETLIGKVAEQNGWSFEELGDRVIPTAGLDDTGVLELPCGPDEKRYVATLADDYTFLLTNPDGKVVKSLPAGTDDTTKAAKKQFSASKKELKQIVSMQSARLYEGLCGGRVWDLADWQRDFRDHPVMRRLTERLVWEGLGPDGAPQGCFRPTAEGEFTDAEDAPVDPKGFAKLRLAHGALLSSDAVEAWQNHLKDYEVTPLFPQFGRALKRVDGKDAQAEDIPDRKGWVVESFALRGVATKLGYERGTAEDGGWFFDYRKRFATAGIIAVIDFTGNFLPEENRPVALISLRFVKPSKGVEQRIKLGNVPKVLLSECWNDLHDMAAKGAHDPDWETSTQW
ncbi:MAG: DUF4132 domain-containing protein [Pseudomonadota bacterium]